ncbi:hypothetical protein FRB90_011715 [Tulasnella sp. 427]|nr:hypothetical protein FRB90_011715 [Tulasnella sp. 427]
MVNRRIDVYFNGGTAQDGTIWSYDPSLYPVDASGKKIYIQALNEAQTTFKLDIGADRYLGADRPQEHEYPFDRYFWGVSVALANPLNTSEEIPIVGVNPTGLANNFIPSISDDRPISQTLIMLDGTARTLKGRQVDVRFDRNATAKTFVMAIFLVNWALTLLVSHTTVLSLASKDPRVDASDKALVLPVTVILTIPSLRALFPESPPFGVNIDNVGLFLQMIIVSICSLLLLIKGSRHNERRQNFVNHVQSPHYLFSRPSLSTGEDLYVQGLANPEGGLERSSQPKRKRSQAGYETDPKSKINKVSGFSSNVSEDPDRVP